MDIVTNIISTLGLLLLGAFSTVFFLGLFVLIVTIIVAWFDSRDWSIEDIYYYFEQKFENKKKKT